MSQPSIWPATPVNDDERAPAFLGRGWGFPPSFSRYDASVAMCAGDADIQESLWIILSTNLGERVMLASFGCDLWSQVFTTLTTTTANEMGLMVRNAIMQWEPRVTVEEVNVTASASGPGWIDIHIAYRVRQTNSRSNLVFPYYRFEASIASPGG